jgi:glutathione peroxidase
MLDGSIGIRMIDGRDAVIGDFFDRVVLLVNVASKCGFTGQYGGLQALHEEFKDRGFTVLGAPCNDFLGQEPGDDAEIRAFCETTYGVTFPMLSKVSILGEGAHPLYKSLQGMDGPIGGRVGWNFTKYVIGRGGGVRARFVTDTTADSVVLRREIEAALAGSS